MSRPYSGVVGQDGKRDDFPLAHAVCCVSVVDVNVHAKLSQTYVSTADEAQQVSYLFPLPSDAAVCAFEAVFDDSRIVKGQVRERRQAQQEFDQAVSAGKRAALLKQHNAQVFEVSLGNLEPKHSITVNIEFVSVISHSGTIDSLRIRLPVTVAPFYGTPPETLQQHMPALRVNSALELAASFQMNGPVTSITSDTVPISVNLGTLGSQDEGSEYDPTRAHISLATNTLLKDDIVLELKCPGLNAPRCAVQRIASADGIVTDALSLSLIPRFAAYPVQAQEYIFLVDRSGSMEGGRILAVRNALQIMLRSLPARGSTFNVASFGSRCTLLWPQSVEYSKENVEHASRHVDAMKADYGGTEVGTAFKHVFLSRKGGTKEPTAVFILTDGETWDLKGTFQIVADAVAESDKALRVFTLGVGNQVSTEMCDGIARAGRGVATYVRGGEKLDAKLVGLLKAARNAVVEDLQIDWGVPPEFADDFEKVEAPSSTSPTSAPTTVPAVSLFDPTITTSSAEPALGPPDGEPVVLPPPPRLQQAPAQLDALPALYPGFRYNVFALIRRETSDDPLPVHIALRGRMLKTPVTLDVPVVAAATGAQFVHVLAARALVESIEDANKASGSGQLTAVERAKISRLGITYGIATSQTSFVAVDEQKGTPVSIPQRSPSSAGSLQTSSDEEESDEDMGFGSAPTRMRFLRTAGSEEEEEEESDDDMGFALMDDEPSPAERLYTPRKGGSPFASAYLRADGSDGEVEGGRSYSPTDVVDPPTVADLARQQAFDGSFPDTDAFVLKVLQMITPPPVPDGVSCAVWNTVLVLAYLEKHLTSADEREAWELLAEKAREFVLGSVENIDPGDLAKWIADATPLV